MELASKAFKDAHVKRADVAEALGEDGKAFLAVMDICRDIIENPTEYYGIRAARTANELAAWRTEIGILKQTYKSGEVENKKLKNNIYEVLFVALESNIDALKKIASFGLVN